MCHQKLRRGRGCKVHVRVRGFINKTLKPKCFFLIYVFGGHKIFAENGFHYFFFDLVVGAPCRKYLVLPFASVDKPRLA